MKPFSINRNSWHFKVACFGTDHLDWNCETNTCEYTTALIKALFKAALLAVIFSIMVAVFVVSPVVGIYGGMECGFLSTKDSLKACLGSGLGTWTSAGHVVLGLYIFMALITGIKFLYERSIENLWKMPKSVPKKSGIFKELYSSWKNKTCAKIEIKD